MIGDKYGEGEAANISVDSQTLSLQTEGTELTGLGERWKVCAIFPKLHYMLYFSHTT